MSEERKSLRPCIVALLIGLLVLYVASFGPARALVERGILKPAVLRWGVFRPCYMAFLGPEPVRTLAWGLVRICGGEEAILAEIAKDALEDAEKKP